MLAAGGCSSGGASTVGASRQWIRQQGGLSPQSAESDARLAAIASRLAAATQSRMALSVTVLQQQAPAAFAWHNGEVYVTAGLLETMNDAELTAVIAHELGHLMQNGEMPGVVSVVGQSSADRNAEMLADAHAVRLLTQMHLPPSAMRSALGKVLKAQPAGSSLRSQLSQRMDVLP